jgi:hypothetical protein
MSAGTVIAFVLALASTTLTSLAYLREHDAAASMPALSMRRPLHSAALLFADRGWLLGFAMESSGFLLYASALALAPLALVQSIVAGGIGLLAYFSTRLGGGQLGTRHLLGAGLSVLGLLCWGCSRSPSRSQTAAAAKVTAARPSPCSSGLARRRCLLWPSSCSAAACSASPSRTRSPVGCASRSATSRRSSRRKAARASPSY